MVAVKGWGCLFAENAFKRDQKKGSINRFSRIEQSLELRLVEVVGSGWENRDLRKNAP